MIRTLTTTRTTERSLKGMVCSPFASGGAGCGIGIRTSCSCKQEKYLTELEVELEYKHTYMTIKPLRVSRRYRALAASDNIFAQNDAYVREIQLYQN